MIEDGFGLAGQPVELSSFSDVSDLIKAHMPKPFDALFLDIDMPGMDGVAAGNMIRSQGDSCCIVYISSWEDRVFDTFAVSPLRFIRKSRLNSELEEAVRAVVFWAEKRAGQNLVISTQGKLLSLPVKTIIYIECWAKRQNIVTESGPHEIRSTLRELEEKLQGKGFLKPHKGYIVNYRFVQSIEDGNMTLLNGVMIPVSKYRLTEVRQEYLALVTRNVDT